MQKCKKHRDKELGCAAQERDDDDQPASGMKGGKDLAVKKGEQKCWREKQKGR